MKKNFFRSDLLIGVILLLIAGAVFSTLIWYARSTGTPWVDDAYITFRYAENLAAGKGFVYNTGERTLGTTTPLFCLLLALVRRLGWRTGFGADFLNILALSFSSLLAFIICRDAKDRFLGILSAFLFIGFPFFYGPLLLGMETMVTIFFALLFFWLDLKSRPILAGIAGGLLLLTRIDALALVAAVGLLRLWKNPRQVVMMGLACVGTMLPWLIFAQIYFGSPIPQSIMAKKLIHPLPAFRVFQKYTYWFLGMSKTKMIGWQFLFPHILVLTLLALFGTVRALWKEHWALAFPLWIIFFIGGMTYGRVRPFLWYQTPMLSGYLILAALGLQGIFQLFLRQRKKLADRLCLLTLLFLIGWQIKISHLEGIPEISNKERSYMRVVNQIKDRIKPEDKVLVGELGVLGYELLDYYVIDSSGLVSKRVYQLRREDYEKWGTLFPHAQWDGWGTPEWAKQVIKEYDPRFIITDTKDLHLPSLRYDREFTRRYQPFALEQTAAYSIIGCERKAAEE